MELLEKIKTLIDGTNKTLLTENANKNVRLVSTQRDYMAGEVSKEYAKKYIYSEDVIDAHNKGLIHLHDLDYSANLMTNCCLVNLEDMLQNGTVMNGTKIYKPKSLMVATTLATQIIQAVSSSQFGGQSVNLAHLAPFVEVSRQKIRHSLIDECSNNSVNMSTEQIDKITESRLKIEIKDAIQTFQHQVVTMSSGNGQSPFITLFMYLGDCKNEQTKKDLSLLIEEILKQRITGLPNEQGLNVSPTFPKLVYVLEEDNIHPNSKFWYLTQLAAECTARRMVPDYISEKIMRKLKVDSNGVGHTFSPMGCLDFNEVLKVTTQEKTITTIKIGQLFEDIYTTNNLPSHKATHIKKTSDRNKFLKHGHILYNGADFNTWALGFLDKYKRKATKQDFKDFTGTELDPPLIMKHRGANLQLINQWDSYYELKVCDILNHNNYKQIDFIRDCTHTNNYIRNHIFTLLDGSKKQLDIYFPLLNIGIDINDTITHNPLKSKSKKEAFRRLGISLFELWDNEITDGSFIHILSEYLKHDLQGITNNDFDIIVTPRTICINLENLGINKYVEDIDGSFTKIKCIIRNSNIDNWVTFKMESGKTITVTTDHPFIIDTGQIIADELQLGDYLLNKSGKKEIIKEIIHSNKINYSYDIETETNSFIFSGIQSHNCRSFLSPYIDTNNKPKYWGRFNLGVITLNLPHIALSAKGDLTEFWNILDERANLVKKAHLQRVNFLKQAKSDVAPILWQHGAIARLKKGDPISKLFYDGYSTISIGYAGIYETVKVLTGETHTSEKGQELAINILKKLNKYCDEWQEETRLGFSIYGTPLESTTGKLANALRRDFGEIDEVSNHEYITNSYHINVREPIDAFSKLEKESAFQALSLGGAISYIEVPDLTANIPAVLEVIKYIYNHIMYAELNTRADLCAICGYTGEIVQTRTDFGEFIWECPNCGNKDLDKMSVVRRTCGYLSSVSNGVSTGRQGDYVDRIFHL